MRRIWIVLVLLMIAACSSQSDESFVVPTVRELPTLTPSPAITVTAQAIAFAIAIASTETLTPISPSEAAIGNEIDQPTATASLTLTLVPPTITPDLTQIRESTWLAELAATQTQWANILSATPSPLPTEDTSYMATVHALVTQMNATAFVASTATAQTPTATPIRVDSMRSTTYYARSTANIRTCPDRDCEIVAQLEARERLTVNGSTPGEAINAGNGLWYRVRYRNREGYVYSSLVMDQLPSPTPTATSYTIYIPQNTPYVPSGSSGSSGLSCGTCSSMSSCSEARACLAAGHTSLDRDHDGVPCESICPGG